MFSVQKVNESVCALKMGHFTQMDLQETLASESNSDKLISGQGN